MSVTDLTEYRRRKLERELESDPAIREWWEYLKDRLTWAGVFRKCNFKRGVAEPFKTRFREPELPYAG